MTLIPPHPTPDLLEAAYAVNRFLLKERDLAAMLQGICDRLTGEGLHSSVMLVLLDRDSGGVITAEAGLGERFAPIMARLREGRLPACGMRALQAEEGEVVLCDGCDCGICPESDATAPPRALAAALRCTSSLSGFLTLQLPPAEPPTPFRTRIAADLADSITLALRHLFAKEAARQREQELKRIEERYELALHASQAGLWDWNIRTGEMHTSPDQWELLDYRAGDADPANPVRSIHPEDRDRVLAVLNEHLTGKTDEYRMEYRVREKDGEWTWFLDRGRVVERDENNMPVRMTGTHQNITLQKKQDQALAAVQQQLHEALNHERNFLQTVIDSAGDPVMVIDLNYNLLLINQAAARLVQNGGPIASMQGQKCHHLFCGADVPCQDLRFPCPVREVSVLRRQMKLIHNPYHGNNVNNTFELEVSPLRDSRGELYGIIEVARDITDRLRIEKELRDSQSHFYRLAHHDTLTGLPNRLLFRDRLAQALIKAERNRSGVAILFLDLDRFKVINDTLGHDVGDLLLVEVAQRLQRHCRQSDTVARLGGDEFIFILETVANRKDAGVVADKIMAALSKPVFAKGHELNITTSIGIAFYPNDSSDIDGVIKCADIALYTAKEIGRSNYQFYRQDAPQDGRRRSQLDAGHFRQALDAGDMSVAYLPQYHLHTGDLAGFAACLQWQHPETELLRTEVLLLAAEECGMLDALAEWFAAEVCRTLHSWGEQGKRCLPVTIPIACRHMPGPGFFSLVTQLPARHAIAPELLILELPEDTIADATAQELESITGLGRADMGLRVGDFGTGRCAISRLAQLPVRSLALNSEMVAGIAADEKTATLAAALIGFGHALGLRVLAPGVEQEAQLACLRLQGCDQAQGPLFSQPLTPDAVPLLLAAGQKGG